MFMVKIFLVVARVFLSLIEACCSLTRDPTEPRFKSSYPGRNERDQLPADQPKPFQAMLFARPRELLPPKSCLQCLFT